ncbi:MAG TPA: Gmad2 immunoglobulin-like domain-containing protein [Dehalococcoidia bacterium]
MPRFLILMVVAVALLGVAACGDDDGGETPTPSPTETASPGQTPSPTAVPDVCLPNPDPATEEFQVLHNPQPFTSVVSPLVATGLVNYFEAAFQIAVYDENGVVLAEAFGTAQQPDAGVLGPFIQGVEFTVEEPTPACLWVFEASAMDGSPINVGQIPLLLLP